MQRTTFILLLLLSTVLQAFHLDVTEDKISKYMLLSNRIGSHTWQFFAEVDLKLKDGSKFSGPMLFGEVEFDKLVGVTLKDKNFFVFVSELHMPLSVMISMQRVPSRPLLSNAKGLLHKLNTEGEMFKVSEKDVIGLLIYDFGWKTDDIRKSKIDWLQKAAGANYNHHKWNSSRFYHVNRPVYEEDGQCNYL